MNTNVREFCYAPRLCVSLFLFLAVAGCAESDPYKRLEPRNLVECSTKQLVNIYNSRWPQQFKCVQTVTIDFGPVTKTFTALLAIQRPGKFRLQGMTEQGVKIFELIHADGRDHVVFKADEMNDQTVASISRNIRKVFLDTFSGVPSSTHDGEYFYLEGNSARLTQRIMLVAGAGVGTWAGRDPTGVKPGDFGIAWVDRVETKDDEGRLFCYATYEWVNIPAPDDEHFGFFYPSVIVLRDSGRESKSYPYKLTIKITELTVRDAPWPDKTFKP